MPDASPRPAPAADRYPVRRTSTQAPSLVWHLTMLPLARGHERQLTVSGALDADRVAELPPPAALASVRARRPTPGVSTTRWSCSRRRSRPPSSWSSTPRPTASEGRACELTEVGAVLVGGGELHDRWSSLVRTSAPLRRGIQRFTGITQAMVDGAPSLEEVLPPLAELLRGRVMVAHNAPFDRRVLRQAFGANRARVAQPAGDLHGRARARDAPAPAPARPDRARRRARNRGRAGAPGAADAETCGRVLCALMPRLCANASTVAEALKALAPRRPRRRLAAKASSGHFPARRPVHGRSANARSPDFADLPRDPGVYLFRDDAGSRPVRRQVGLDSQPGTGSLRPVGRAGRVDRARIGRRLPRPRARSWARWCSRTG